MKKLSKMGSATDLPALKQPPRLRRKSRARPRPSSSCSGIRGLALDPVAGISTHFDQFRLISTEKLFRAPFGQFLPGANEQLRPDSTIQRFNALTIQRFNDSTNKTYVSII